VAAPLLSGHERMTFHPRYWTVKPFEKFEFRKRLKRERLLHADCETFCELDLKKVGAHKYAMHSSCDALCWQFKFSDSEDLILWLPGMPLPSEIEEHILMGGLILAWNAQFERLILWHVMATKYGWPKPAYSQFVCVMVIALSMSLPGKLEKAAEAVAAKQLKDMHGHRIMMKVSRPRKPTKTDKRTRWTPQSIPLQFEHLYRYCGQDVLTEEDVFHRITPMVDVEFERYWRDQEIQDRGVPLDIELIEKARKIAEAATAKLDAELREITMGDDGLPAIQSTRQTKQIVDYLKADGLEWPANKVPSIDKENLTQLLARDDLTNSQRRIIEIRHEAAKTSTAKLDRAEQQMCLDGTAKGQLQFCGAGATGRDAARGLQLQNLPRPDKKIDVKGVIADILEGRSVEEIEITHGPVLSAIASILRGIVVSRPGRKLYARDLSQIEARMTAWLAREMKVVQAFQAYDEGRGPDIYTVQAGEVYDKPPAMIDKEGDERQVGKVCVLSLGFGGGASAFRGMAKIYNLDIVPLLPTVWELAEADDREKAVDSWKGRGRKSGMVKDAWLTAELIKLKWRAANPNIVQTWHDLEEAAIKAMLRPGETITVRNMAYRKTGSWLRAILPSGRSLFYAFPTLREVMTPWGKKKLTIFFKAVDGLTKQWREFSLYGGLQFQNFVQAGARDVMWEIVDRCEAHGFPNILRVHDEGIFDVAANDNREELFNRLFIQRPEWAPDLPIAASGFIAERYKK
jgi:DNA polymerase